MLSKTNSEQYNQRRKILQDRVNKIIRLADIRLIFHDLQIPYKEKKHTDLWFNCIIHGHRDKDASAHICADRISMVHGLWKCFGCKTKGTIIDLVKIQLNLSFWESLLWIEARLGHEPIGDRVSMVLPKALPQLPIDYEYYNDIEKWNPIYLNYLYSRGVTWNQITKYRIGYCDKGKYKRRVIVPIRLGCMLRSWEARTIWKGIKSLACPGGMVGLFGSEYTDPTKGPAIVVEGWVDKLKLDRMGFDNVMSLQTNQIHEDQFQFLEQFDSIIVIPDSDNGGDYLIDSLSVYVDRKEIYLVELPRGEDPDSCDENILEQAIDCAKEWSPYKEDVEVGFIY